ncbi:hypothetical protein, partial [Staphylococcus pasteuri_A]
LIQMLKSKWAITLLGFLAVAFLIWFGGPLIAIAGSEPLGSAAARWFTIITLALICIIYQFWQHIQSTKQNQQAVQSLL